MVVRTSWLTDPLGSAKKDSISPGARPSLLDSAVAAATTSPPSVCARWTSGPFTSAGGVEWIDEEPDSSQGLLKIPQQHLSAGPASQLLLEVQGMGAAAPEVLLGWAVTAIRPPGNSSKAEKQTLHLMRPPLHLPMAGRHHDERPLPGATIQVTLQWERAAPSGVLLPPGASGPSALVAALAVHSKYGTIAVGDQQTASGDGLPTGGGGGSDRKATRTRPSRVSFAVGQGGKRESNIKSTRRGTDAQSGMAEGRQLAAADLVAKLPNGVWINSKRKTAPTQPYHGTDGFDLYIDGARFLPCNVTISKVSRGKENGEGK